MHRNSGVRIYLKLKLPLCKVFLPVCKVFLPVCEVFLPVCKVFRELFVTQHDASDSTNLRFAQDVDVILTKPEKKTTDLCKNPKSLTIRDL